METAETMKLTDSQNKPAGRRDLQVQKKIEEVNTLRLKDAVRWISVPRHISQKANAEIREEIRLHLEASGFKTEVQGRFANVVAFPNRLPTRLVGAHYDSVPGTPGADDNGSAVAGLLEAARVIGPENDVAFVAFNAEEDNLGGSRDFVSHLNFPIREAHVLEMIGYTSAVQSVPAELPITIPKTGDFLALLANRRSNRICEQIVQNAKTYELLTAIGLKIYLGLERHIPVLLRSDHAAFWERDIPCVMWTDTSEFRNPNYHSENDTPETLDYVFLTKATQLLVSHLAGERQPAAASGFWKGLTGRG